MEEVPGYVAPVATMAAAMMTAANLGARVTGWGFVVFTVGSIAWSIVGATTGQGNLLFTNLFLTAVNVVGVWRWLGREARWGKGGRRATEGSARGEGPALVSACTLLNAPIHDASGEKIATVVDAMLSREGRELVYLIASRGGVGGVGERLHPIDPRAVELGAEVIETRLSGEEIDRLPVLEPDRWPADLPREARMG